MRNTCVRVRKVAIAAALLAGCFRMHGGELIFSQLDDGQSNHGPSNHAPGGPVDAEVADDFDLTASIDRIVAYGFNFPNPVPDFAGVYVRFYASSGTGGPGALQAERFVGSGDPNLINGLEVAGWLDITLATPFSASGQHFVSVQPVTATPWYRWSAHSHAVQGQPFYYRDPGSGVPNWQNDDGLGSNDTDIAFLLYGTVTAAGHIDSLSAASLPRSGYLEIFGTNFGGSGSVEIDGIEAPVADWDDGRIVAYVPELAALGSVNVRITNGSGQPSNSVSLDVTTRQSDGRVQWRFRMNGPYAQVRPAVGPDGTIYAVDAFDHLYALSPDGGLKWLVRGAGGKGVAVDAAGDVYTGNEAFIRAFHSDGSEKWTFVQSEFALILVGIAVGPDGNIYAAASEGMGVFSLTPGGELRWQTPNPYDRIIIDYNEIVFGDNDGAGQLYFWANNKLRGITLSGNPVFSIAGGLPQLQVANSPAVGPDGSVHTALSSFSPDGNPLWTFPTPYPYNVFSKSSVGSDGSHYLVQNLIQLYALHPNGTVRWHRELDDYAKGPIVDPTNTQILLGGAATLDHPGLILSASAENGGELWRVELPSENGFNQFVDSRARFRDDGLAVYLVTATATGDNATSRSFVYGLDASLDGPPPPPPSPSIYAVTPPSGPAEGGSALTIEGSGYLTGASVSIGGAAAIAEVVDGATIDAAAPTLPPGTLNDLTVTNPDTSSVTVPDAWFSDFLDVPQTDIFHAYVEKIFRLGITAGCASGVYCRDAPLTRAQMAVFLIKASTGPGYAPASCVGVFADVPCPGPFADWIEDLAARGITGGCGGGNYCPGEPVTRQQMAVFLLKTEHGTAYSPPLCAGIFADVACPSLFADWIEQLAAEEITGGCGSGDYCPTSPSTRGQTAVFLVRALSLP
jgi:hypothetical protein